MVGQEQRTAPDAAEQTEETQRLRAAEAQAQQQARRRVSSIDVYFILTEKYVKVRFSHCFSVFFFRPVEAFGVSWDVT